MASGVTAIAYETITAPDGSLPLLAPMSEIAGRMSVAVAAHCLMKAQGGAGLLPGGVPGVPPAKFVVLGGGVAGSHAARMALGLGADVTIVDRSLPRLRQLAAEFGPALKTEYSTRDAVEQLVRSADVVIGSVLIRGEAAPRLVTREMVAGMQPGSVLVDIAIDQGGCFETSRPDQPRRADLHRKWRGALLRHQHARGGAAHVDRGTDACDIALHPPARGQGRGRGAHGRSAFPARTQCGRRRNSQRAGGARTGTATAALNSRDSHGIHRDGTSARSTLDPLAEVRSVSHAKARKSVHPSGALRRSGLIASPGHHGLA